MGRNLSGTKVVHNIYRYVRQVHTEWVLSVHLILECKLHWFTCLKCIYSSRVHLNMCTVYLLILVLHGQIELYFFTTT